MNTFKSLAPAKSKDIPNPAAKIINMNRGLRRIVPDYAYREWQLSLRFLNRRTFRSRTQVLGSRGPHSTSGQGGRRKQSRHSHYVRTDSDAPIDRHPKMHDGGGDCHEHLGRHDEVECFAIHPEKKPKWMKLQDKAREMRDVKQGRGAVVHHYIITGV